MNALALADFGSTFTKVALVEPENGRLLGLGQAPTTIATDVMEGYEAALAAARADCARPVAITARLAASSAGGGLRVAAVGLVADYTAEAARQAALNAGARIECVLSGRLGADDIATLEASRPEIVLFSGGTDGGQREQVLANAEMVGGATLDARIIIACNREIATEVAQLVGPAGRVEIVANVLPKIRTLDIEPARTAIHEAFIRHVIRGKGLSQSREFGGTVIMPTPEAVLLATGLLAKGAAEHPGLGDVVVVDIGGATTDVHAAVSPKPVPAGVRTAGLPSLPLRRTVEGDLGMRWSAPSVLAADGAWLETACSAFGLDRDALARACARRRDDPGLVATGDNEDRLDRALAVACIAHALRRHCGTRTTVYVPGQGADFEQRGADLRAVPLVIGTGGMLARHPAGTDLLAAAVARQSKGALTPTSPRLLIDTRYILAGAGLLSTISPAGARTLLRTMLASGEPTCRDR